MIKVENLGFAFSDAWLFRGITLEVFQGDFVAVVGPNGSGKSTFLRLLLRQLTPSEGGISLYGVPAPSFRDWQKIGYVAQNPARQQKYFPATVREVVSMGLLSGKNIFSPCIGDKEKEEVRRQLELVDMWEARDRLIGQLSGGQQQRVFIAKALAGCAELLLLDEPASGIDADAKKDLYEILSRLNREKGITIMMVSHDMELAAQAANKALCMETSDNYYWGESSHILLHKHDSGYYYTGGGLGYAGNV